MGNRSLVFIMFMWELGLVGNRSLVFCSCRIGFCVKFGIWVFCLEISVIFVLEVNLECLWEMGHMFLIEI